jgi:hypothetical protein
VPQPETIAGYELEAWIDNRWWLIVTSRDKITSAWSGIPSSQSTPAGCDVKFCKPTATDCPGSSKPAVILDHLFLMVSESMGKWSEAARGIFI